MKEFRFWDADFEVVGDLGGSLGRKGFSKKA